MRYIKYIIIFSIFIYSSNLTFAQIKAVVAVTGSIFNYIDKQPVSAKIQVYDNTGKKVNSTKSNASDNGYYFVTGLYPGNTYSFAIDDPKFLAEKFEVIIPNSDKYIEFSKDFLLKPNHIGTSIKLNVSPFELNKSKLKAGSALILNEILNTLKNNSNIKFKIVSYPDSDKDTKLNSVLTSSRAQALIDYFELNGIDSNLLSFQANSNTDPKDPPPTSKRAKGKNYIGPIYFIIE